MATLVLGALGTLIGGPIGGAIGALAGRGIDGSLIGSGGRREGPRLRDLAITTSSYGQPIARHYGRMRVAGSVIWATDLVENSETSGGGKGKPKTTNYSYSSSFAVALSSRPIASVGRVWADGNLLRGTGGDLKASGSLRVHTGHGDQMRDPLIAAAQGSACPAFRNLAYVVFEDLELADFGNRIPVLSFEVFADPGGVALGDVVLGDLREPGVTAGVALDGLAGFSCEGGSLRADLETIDTLFPLACDAGGDGLTIGSGAPDAASAPALPPPVAALDEEEFGARGGFLRERDAAADDGPDAVRYYDLQRDFQPGLQRREGAAVRAGSRTLDFPGTLSAGGARERITAAGQRARWLRDRIAWRIAELDPAVRPGRLVRLPGIDGVWRVAEWEWRERGVELALVRHPAMAIAAAPGEAGEPGLPPDTFPWPTDLRAFELPWDGIGDPSTPAVFAAASAEDSDWRGAALYAERQGVLEPLGTTGRARSVGGALAAALPGSPALILERQAMLSLDLTGADQELVPATTEALTAGANRLLVGDEILQFVQATREGEHRWLLRGLLRGRGGTERAAQAGHAAGTRATLLDARLVPLQLEAPDGTPADAVAAIGRAEDAPVVAPIENAGATRRPLAPVHPHAAIDAAGALTLGWMRRARGAWGWPDGIDAPLVEEAERYRIGIGPADAPVASWTVAEPALSIAPGDLAPIAAAHPGAPVWVRQIGSFAASDPLHLHDLA